MTTRSNFLKIELQKIYDRLNMSYEIRVRVRKFKVFELVMEISEKSNTLNKVVKGNYLFM